MSGTVEAGRAADVWSCAVHLYTMLFAQFPFNGNTPGQVEYNIAMINVTPPPEGAADVDTMDLLNRMFVMDPMERITIPEIKRHKAFLKRLPRQIWVCFITCRCSKSNTLPYPLHPGSG